jgi:hypothetical protein
METYQDDSESAEELEDRPAPAGDPEVPEGDALEQHAELRPGGDLPDEVGDRPEADALEQARDAGGDDEEEDRR